MQIISYEWRNHMHHILKKNKVTDTYIQQNEETKLVQNKKKSLILFKNTYSLSL